MAYRDDQATLQTRRDELQKELASIEEKATALRDAVQEKDAVARELASIEARMAKLQGRRLPLLDDVRIASPCTALWADMIGDDHVRFCGQCQKNVYDLSAMAREEAERLLAEKEGGLCVRLYRRSDGTVLSGDCTVGLKRLRRRRAAFSVLGLGALATTAFFGLRATVCPTRTMGAVAIAPSFVEVQVSQHKEPGLVLTYWRTTQSGEERWYLYEDGRVFHTVNAQSAPKSIRAEPAGAEVLAAILPVVARVQRSARGVLYGHEDSAYHIGFEVYGRGTQPLSPAEAEALYNRMVSLSFRPDPQ